MSILPHSFTEICNVLSSTPYSKEDSVITNALDENVNYIAFLIDSLNKKLKNEQWKVDSANERTNSLQRDLESIRKNQEIEKQKWEGELKRRVWEQRSMEQLFVAEMQFRDSAYPAAAQTYQIAFQVLQEKNDPEFADIYFHNAQAHMHICQYEPAIAALSSSLRINGQNYHAHQMQGDAFLRLLQLQEAINCYRRSLELNPQYKIASAKLFLAQGNLPEAKRLFLECIPEVPEWDKFLKADLLEFLAIISLKENHLPMTREFLQMILQLFPLVDFPFHVQQRVYTLLGICFFEERNFEELKGVLPHLFTKNVLNDIQQAFNGDKPKQIAVAEGFFQELIRIDLDPRRTIFWLEKALEGLAENHQDFPGLQQHLQRARAML